MRGLSASFYNLIGAGLMIFFVRTLNHRHFPLILYTRQASFLPARTHWLILILNTQAVLQGEFSVISAAKGMYGNDMLNGKQISVLEEAIRAYRLFVKLVLLPHLPKVYPTYAVDLVWHTHQLQGPEYK